ncbi:hypothetical protein BTHI11S_02798 [Bosea thiooxidans]
MSPDLEHPLAVPGLHLLRPHQAILVSVLARAPDLADEIVDDGVTFPRWQRPHHLRDLAIGPHPGAPVGGVERDALPAALPRHRHLRRQRRGNEEEPADQIPPHVGSGADRAGRKEDRGGAIQPGKGRSALMQDIGIAVVEGDRRRPRDRKPLRHAFLQPAQRYHRAVPLQHCDLLGQLAGRHGQMLRVAAGGADTVIHQDDAAIPRRERAPEGIGGALEQSIRHGPNPQRRPYPALRGRRGMHPRCGRSPRTPGTAGPGWRCPRTGAGAARHRR